MEKAREEGARKACLASTHNGAMNTNIHGEWTGSEVLLLDYDGAARALSMSRPALRDLVYKGRGPRVTKIGRRTFFAVKDLEAFIDRHREPAITETQEPIIVAQAQTRPSDNCGANGPRSLPSLLGLPSRKEAQPALRWSSFASWSARKSPVRFA